MSSRVMMIGLDVGSLDFIEASLSSLPNLRHAVESGKKLRGGPRDHGRTRLAAYAGAGGARERHRLRPFQSLFPDGGLALTFSVRDASGKRRVAKDLVAK